MRYFAIESANVAIPTSQYREMQTFYRNNYHGDEYRGRNDFDKFLYERFLNNNRSIDQDCSETLEELKQKNIPDGTPKSHEQLMAWENRSGSGDRARNEKGLFV